MARLTITDFNNPYFWGRGGNMEGGYGYYLPVRCAHHDDLATDQWLAKAQWMIDHGSLVGRTVIDLGCGFGSIVRYLRQLGADAYGIDLSYPISQGVALWPELEPYLMVGDVRVWLPTQGKNSWDVIISRGFLDCLTDAELATLVPAMNNAAKFQQIHSVDPSDDPEYYNQKTLVEWEALDWEPGTIILDEAN